MGKIKGNWVVAVFRVARVGLIECTFEQRLDCRVENRL